MDLISTLRYEAQKRKEEEERKAKEAEAAAGADTPGDGAETGAPAAADPSEAPAGEA